MSTLKVVGGPVGFAGAATGAVVGAADAGAGAGAGGLPPPAGGGEGGFAADGAGAAPPPGPPVFPSVANSLTPGATTFDIDHNFNTRDVTVQVFDSASYDTVFTDVVRSTANKVIVTFSVAPGASSYRIVVTG